MKLPKKRQSLRSNSRQRKKKENLQGGRKIKLPLKKRKPLPDKRTKSQKRKFEEDPPQRNKMLLIFRKKSQRTKSQKKNKFEEDLPKRSKMLLIFWKKIGKNQRLLKSREQGQSREQSQRRKREETSILPRKKSPRKKE